MVLRITSSLLEKDMNALTKLRKYALAAIFAVAALALPLESFAAIQLSTRVRNAMLDAMETTIGTAAHIQIWAGTIPANCATTAVGQTKLVDFTLASDWAAAAASGSKAFNAITGTAATATGTAAFYRLTDSTDVSTSCDEQGTITATGGGGDMTIDNTSIASGQTVNITGWSWTEPGA
jgi:hypothetical protein